MNRRILAATGAVVLASTTACGGGTADDDNDEEPTSVTVGVLPIVDVAPIHLGVEQGFFEDHGLDVELENSDGGANVASSVAEGAYEFGFSNTTSLVLDRSEGTPVTVVSNGATTTGEQGEDFGAIVAPEDSNISSAADLEGATVAVNTTENIGDTTVRNSIREDGGDADDVEFSPMSFSEMPAALDDGDVDAAWMVEPTLTTALEGGSEEITSNFVDTHESLSVASYFTSEEYQEDNPETVESFSAAMNESLNYADGHPAEVRRIVSSYTEIDEQLVEEIRLPSFPSEPDRESAEMIGALMLQDGMIEEEPDIDGLFQGSE